MIFIPNALTLDRGQCGQSLDTDGQIPRPSGSRLCPHLGGLSCLPVSNGSEQQLSLKCRKRFMCLPKTDNRKFGLEVLKGRNQLCHVHSLAFLVGEIEYIPGIKLYAKKCAHCPFLLISVQFPVKHAFAVTINNSQGQT
ncbi:TPA: hypothetical protein ACH3X1_001003 [Trebouxia sp. C0004]